MRAVAVVWNECLEAGRAFSKPARQYLTATVLLWFGQGIQLVLFNLYLVDLGFSEIFIGYTLGLSGLGIAIAALPGGMLSERLGCRSILVTGFACEGAGALARACLVEPGLLLASSALYGAGMALVAVAGPPFLTEHSTPKERTFLFSGLQSVALGAQVVGSIVGGALPAILLSATGLFVGCGIAASRAVLVLSALFIFAAAWPLVTLRGMPVRSGSGTKRLLSPDSRQVARRAVQVFFLVGAGIGLVVPFMNIYFSQKFASPASQIGFYFSAAAVCTATASMIGASLGQRYGALRTVTGFLLLALPFLVTLGLVDHLVTAVVVFLLGVTLVRVGLPLLQSAVMSAIPASDTSRVSGMMLLSWSVGWSASTALSGTLIARAGFAAPFTLAAVLLAAASLILFMIFRGKPRQVPSHRLTPTAIDP